jgi:anaerobic selenocysteine-containing dehydrogenase
MLDRVDGFNILKGEGTVEINPEDAAKLGIVDGEMVKVSSRWGEVTAGARVTEASLEGVVFMTFRFAGSPASLLASPTLDPATKIPEFKPCAVRVEKT